MILNKHSYDQATCLPPYTHTRPGPALTAVSTASGLRRLTVERTPAFPECPGGPGGLGVLGLMGRAQADAPAEMPCGWGGRAVGVSPGGYKGFDFASTGFRSPGRAES